MTVSTTDGEGANPLTSSVMMQENAGESTDLGNQTSNPACWMGADPAWGLERER